MNDKIKYITIGACALLLVLTVKMCKTERVVSDYSSYGMEDLKSLQQESDSLLSEVIYDIHTKEDKYKSEIDRLSGEVKRGNLSLEDMSSLKREISKTKGLLKAKKLEMKANKLEMRSEKMLAIVSEDIIEETYRDSILYNIIERDSIIYNIIEVDSIVYNTVYLIDTVYYESRDIKKLKLRH